jgi:hypothetical protein
MTYVLSAGANYDLDVLIKGVEKTDYSFYREMIKTVICKRRYLGLGNT